jgi:hypothetical protein
MLEMEGDGAGDARELSRTLKMLEMEDGSRHQNMVLSTKSIMPCLCSNCSRFDIPAMDRGDLGWSEKMCAKTQKYKEILINQLLEFALCIGELNVFCYNI